MTALLRTASLAALAIVAATTTRARAGTCEALDMRTPTDADFERCLTSKPILEAGLVGSLTLGGDTGFRATLLTQLDVRALSPVYASVRARLGQGPYAEVDLVAGYAFKRSYGAGDHTTVTMSNTYNSPTAYGYSYVTTTTAHTDYVVQREAWLVLAGVRGVNRHIDGPDDSTTWDPWKTYLIGIGNHYANHQGQHTRIELFAVVRDGSWGASARWFNSIVGMEVGWVPYANGTDPNTGMDRPSTGMFYWNFVDIGLFKDLF